MAQVKIYGLKESLINIKSKLSMIIHECLVRELSFPKEKKFQRFISMNKDEMFFSDDKSVNYTIIEFYMMTGRTTETKKNLIKSLFTEIENQLGINSNDIEICIIENPGSNWGFRGQTGDEIKLNYKVNI